MGREAWAKIHTSFETWKSICLALAIGRELAFRKSGANAPHGTRYAKCFNAWIKENGFGNMPFGIRASCLRLADHLEETEQWRNDLPGEARQAQNHPQVILRNWRRATGKGETPRGGRARYRITTGRVAKNGRTISWPQELIRKAALAMKESRSTDNFVIAKIGLEHAIRSEADIALLIARPKIGEAARASTAAVHVPVQSFPGINLPVR